MILSFSLSLSHSPECGSNKKQMATPLEGAAIMAVVTRWAWLCFVVIYPVVLAFPKVMQRCEHFHPSSLDLWRHTESSA